MKKFTSLLLTGILTFSLASCSSNEPNADAGADTTTLKIAATSVPHAEILNFIKEDMAAQGVTLEIQEFSDYTLINEALVNGDVDANFFQHQPYLEQYIADTGNQLVNVVNVHVEPIRLYSNSIKDVSELTEGAKIAIPNDAVNEGRSLSLLDELGVITLKDDATILSTPRDIVENPLNIEFIELDNFLLPRALDEAAIAIINTNVALEASVPQELSIAVESSDSPYANAVTVRPEDTENEKIKILSEVITSQKVADFINETYGGAVIPAFTAQ